MINTQRISEIRNLRTKGKTFQEIATLLGISRQRVHQIISYDEDPEYKAKRLLKKREQYRKTKEANCV